MRPGSTLHAHRVRAAASLVTALALAGCGPRGNPPLSPAGANDDDGVGALARSSTKLVFDGAGDDDERGDYEGGGYERTYDYDPLAYYGYGSFGYGGFGYAGYGYGGLVGFGMGGDRGEVPSYDGRGGGSFGAIEGVVTWKADGGVAWPPDCGLARTARAGAPAAGAVVYIERINTGRSIGSRTGGVVTATACGLAPAVQVIGPLPASLVVENASAEPARLQVNQPARELVELDPGGRLELPVLRRGVMELTVPGRAPAWVVAEAHPYYEITDETGRFALDQVPPGPHTLVVWTPPMVTAVNGGVPVWSEPAIERRTIVVPADGLASVQLAVTPGH